MNNGWFTELCTWSCCLWQQEMAWWKFSTDLGKHSLLALLGTASLRTSIQIWFFFIALCSPFLLRLFFAFSKVLLSNFYGEVHHFCCTDETEPKPFLSLSKYCIFCPALFKWYFNVMANAACGVSVLSFPINSSWSKRAQLLLCLGQGRAPSKAWTCRQVHFYLEKRQF